MQPSTVGTIPATFETVAGARVEASRPAGGAPAAVSSLSLEGRTQLDHRLPRSWCGSFIPEAGEATWWAVNEYGALESEDARGLRVIADVAPDRSAGSHAEHREAPADTEGSPLPPADERAPNRERSARRTRTKVRRYAAANRLTRMWVLTSADVVDFREAARRASLFRRRFRRRYPDAPLLVSPEIKPQGHGWDVNALVDRRYAHAEMTALWGHGHVWVSDWRRKVRQPGRSRREVARAAATYVAKYIGKYVGVGGVPDGAHRYEVSEGFQPAVVRVSGGSPALVRARLLVLADGEAPRYEWSSSGQPDWQGPPVGFLSW